MARTTATTPSPAKRPAPATRSSTGSASPRPTAMDDVRYLHHHARRRQQATAIVDGIIARHGAYRLALQMAGTANAIRRLSDDALEATVGLMWFGAHLPKETEPCPS